MFVLRILCFSEVLKMLWLWGPLSQNLGHGCTSSNNSIAQTSYKEQAAISRERCMPAISWRHFLQIAESFYALDNQGTGSVSFKDGSGDRPHRDGLTS